jgi:hypothetical protein
MSDSSNRMGLVIRRLVIAMAIIGVSVFSLLIVYQGYMRLIGNLIVRSHWTPDLDPVHVTLGAILGISLALAVASSLRHPHRLLSLWPLALVAIIGLLYSVDVIGQRRSFCRQMVAYHARQEASTSDREKAARHAPRRCRGQSYWARPVPGLGDPRARLLIVGLAPAAHGGNRTGRIFTGDRSGDWLFASLHRRVAPDLWLLASSLAPYGGRKASGAFIVSVAGLADVHDRDGASLRRQLGSVPLRGLPRVTRRSRDGSQFRLFRGLRGKCDSRVCAEPLVRAQRGSICGRRRSAR